MVTRRELLRGAGTSALVVGFLPHLGSWVAADDGADVCGCPELAGVPPLDGTLVTDDATLGRYGRDQGNIVFQRPCAVLQPGSVLDIQKMVRFCRKHGIKVAARGQGHTMFGQSLVCGLVVDMATLDTIEAITHDRAVVDAGARWRELVEAAVAQGRTPPVLTGYLGLSVGGTLSVGGVSSTNAEGLQIDRVQELQVVTGEGQIQWCSPSKRRDLFEVVLGGLGQCGIITRAVVDVVPAKQMARTFTIEYSDPTVFFRDFRTLLDRGELNDVFTICFPFGTSLTYQINAATFYDLSSPPDNLHLMRGLAVPAAAVKFSDQSYLSYVTRVDTLYETYMATHDWNDKVKAWYDVWLGDATIERYVSEVVPALAPEDVGPTGFVLIFPQRRSRLRRRFYRVPPPGNGTDWVYLFDILTDSVRSGPDPAFADRMARRNRALFDRAREMGPVTRYAIGVLPFDQADWVAHFGPLWPELVELKKRYDPDGILTPGPGIF